MAEIINALDALGKLNGDGQDAANDKDFSKFNVGSSYTVKVIGVNDLFAFYKYGIYSKGGGGVPSFIAKNPSKKSAKGYPVDNLTPWDKAWKYHADQSKEFGDNHSQEAYKYKPELRYVMGFFDLDSGERIVIDVSRKQAATIRESIIKYEKKIGKVAFEVSKGNGGSVSLTPILDMEEDLTDKQRENFGKAPEEFKIEDFHGILYEADDEEMTRTLIGQGFDVSLIGLSGAAKADEEPKEREEDDDILESELPF